MLWTILLNPWAQRIAAVLAVLAAFAGAYQYGKSVARQEAREQAAIDYAETLERLQDEDVDLDDSAAVRRRLCELAGLSECPVQGDGE